MGGLRKKPEAFDRPRSAIKGKSDVKELAQTEGGDLPDIPKDRHPTARRTVRDDLILQLRDAGPEAMQALADKAGRAAFEQHRSPGEDIAGIWREALSQLTPKKKKELFSAVPAEYRDLATTILDPEVQDQAAGIVRRNEDRKAVAKTEAGLKPVDATALAEAKDLVLRLTAMRDVALQTNDIDAFFANPQAQKLARQLDSLGRRHPAIVELVKVSPSEQPAGAQSRAVNMEVTDRGLLPVEERMTTYMPNETAKRFYAENRPTNRDRLVGAAAGAKARAVEEVSKLADELGLAARPYATLPEVTPTQDRDFAKAGVGSMAPKRQKRLVKEAVQQAREEGRKLTKKEATEMVAAQTRGEAEVESGLHSSLIALLKKIEQEKLFQKPAKLEADRQLVRTMMTEGFAVSGEGGGKKTKFPPLAPMSEGGRAFPMPIEITEGALQNASEGALRRQDMQAMTSERSHLQNMQEAILRKMYGSTGMFDAIGVDDAGRTFASDKLQKNLNRSVQNQVLDMDRDLPLWRGEFSAFVDPETGIPMTGQGTPGQLARMLANRYLLGSEARMSPRPGEAVGPVNSSLIELLRRSMEPGVQDPVPDMSLGPSYRQSASVAGYIPPPPDAPAGSPGTWGAPMQYAPEPGSSGERALRRMVVESADMLGEEPTNMLLGQPIEDMRRIEPTPEGLPDVEGELPDVEGDLGALYMPLRRALMMPAYA